MRNKRPQHETDLLTCSIERVINTTIRILENLPRLRDAAKQELVDTNLQDWIELKETTRKVWDEARNEIYKRDMKG